MGCRKIFIGLLALLTVNCGQDVATSGVDQGTGGTGHYLHEGFRLDMSGRVISGGDDPVDIAGWHLLFLEKESGIVYPSSMGISGQYSVQSLREDRAYTMLLVDTEYKIRGLLSMPGHVRGNVRPYFLPRSELPDVFFENDLLQFDDVSGLRLDDDLAAAHPETNMPDGAPSIGLGVPSPSEVSGFHFRDTAGPEFGLDAFEPDFDQDGIPNRFDTDIDGDGIHNVIDPDDDGDTILDPLDGDMNDDLVNDHDQRVGNDFFPDFIDSIEVRYERKADGRLIKKFRLDTNIRNGLRRVYVRGNSQKLGSPMIELVHTNDERDEWYEATFECTELECEPAALDLTLFGLEFDGVHGVWNVEFPHLERIPVMKVIEVEVMDADTSTPRIILNTESSGLPSRNLRYLWHVRVYSDGELVYSSNHYRPDQLEIALNKSTIAIGKKIELKAVVELEGSRSDSRYRLPMQESESPMHLLPPR